MNAVAHDMTARQFYLKAFVAVKMRACLLLPKKKLFLNFSKATYVVYGLVWVDKQRFIYQKIHKVNFFKSVISMLILPPLQISIKTRRRRLNSSVASL